MEKWGGGGGDTRHTLLTGKRIAKKDEFGDLYFFVAYMNRVKKQQQ